MSERQPTGVSGPTTAARFAAGATLVAVAVAWRSGGRGALRVVAASRVLSVITALPASSSARPPGSWSSWP